MKKSFTVTIDAELIAKIKAIAALDGRRMPEVVEYAFRDYVHKKAIAKSRAANR